MSEYFLLFSVSRCGDNEIEFFGSVFFWFSGTVVYPLIKNVMSCDFFLKSNQFKKYDKHKLGLSTGALIV